jgi:hypothetical protein
MHSTKYGRQQSGNAQAQGGESVACKESAAYD